MTDFELAELLSRTVANAPNGEKTNAYVMFGIKYAGELGSRTNAVADLARRYVQFCLLTPRGCCLTAQPRGVPNDCHSPCLPNFGNSRFLGLVQARP